MTDVQVETELKLDSEAARVLDGIKQDFAELNQKVDQSQSVMAGFGTQFAATFAALNLGAIFSGISDAVTSFIDIGSAAYDAEQGIAGLIAGMRGVEWGQARAFAENLNAEINDLSANLGQAKEDIQAGHRALVTFLGGTAEAFSVAGANMANLTTIANVQGLTVQELGREFGRMAAGFVSAESPIFNLLRGTGIFADNVADINKEWSALTQPERIQLLEGAFAKIAGNLAEAPPTLSDMVSSIDAIGDAFLETFGKSAMQGFMDEMDDFRGDLLDARGDFQSLASDMGADVGEMIAELFQVMQQAVAYIRENGDDIRDAVKEGFQFARDTVSWIIENKDTLMMIGAGLIASRSTIVQGVVGVAAGGAATAAGAAASAIGRGPGNSAERLAAAGVGRTTGMIGRLGTALTGFATAGGPAVQLGARLATSIGGLASAVMAGGPPVWAATAAVTAFGAAAIEMADKLNEAEEERRHTIEDSVAEFASITQKMGTLTEQELARLDELRAEAEKLAGDSLVSSRVSEQFEEAWQAREDNILRMYVHPMEKIQEAVTRYAEQAAEEGLFPEEMAAQHEAVTAAARLYQEASRTHNQGAMEYIAKMLGSSKAMRKAFLESAEMTSEGFMGLAKTVRELGEDFSTEFGTQLENIARSQMELEAAKAKPVINFNGGQVFKLKQEFRDQDPDRVVVAFEKRFTNAAISRVQAVTATPFGT